MQPHNSGDHGLWKLKFSRSYSVLEVASVYEFNKKDRLLRTSWSLLILRFKIYWRYFTFLLLQVIYCNTIYNLCMVWINLFKIQLTQTDYTNFYCFSKYPVWEAINYYYFSNIFFYNYSLDANDKDNANILKYFILYICYSIFFQ